MRQGMVDDIATFGPVRNGIDVLAAADFDVLRNRRVAVVTNHTGRLLDGTRTVDALLANPEVHLDVLFSPEHSESLASLGVEQARKIVDVWAERTEALLARPEIEYVLVFENRGREVGATIDHPHGQIYGYPFVPPAPAHEVQHNEGTCRVCREVAADRRQPLQRGLRLDLFGDAVYPQHLAGLGNGDDECL